jgi:D-alanyl-D-alanine carboxypeptidase/D-alanyl-D-alanine-endopeptidase (penicillin-binding protein 4)
LRLSVVASILGMVASPWALGAPSQGLAEEARTILGAGQGVFIEDSVGTVLLDQAGSIPVHPASVSKVPTTLALLRKFGPDYRFLTTFATSGRIVDGTLYGDLLVKSEGDPSLVDENALLVTEHLRELGIHRVVGNLHLVGPLMFDWQSDDGGDRLRQALSGRISAQALAAVRDLQPVDSKGLAATATTPQAIVFVPTANWSATDIMRSKITESPRERPLLVHRSQPLLPLAKSLNDYSNNIFKPLADEAGGAEAVTTVARSVLPETMRGEITLGDGAGTDPRNRLSPRAAVKLLRALEHELAASGHKLYDILPVSGIDEGTLRKRLNGPEEAGRVVGKTGTYGDYGASALIGAIPTTDRGTVYFAILDHGVAVPEARRRQDRFVAALLAHLHSEPWDYRPDVRSAIARAEVLSSPP